VGELPTKVVLKGGTKIREIMMRDGNECWWTQAMKKIKSKIPECG
jgi:hypothetical protein